MKPLKETIQKMRLTGVLEDIWRNYEISTTTTTCGDPMVTLGFKQLTFPILVLVIGIVTSVLVGLMEKLAGFRKHKKKTCTIQVKEFKNHSGANDLVMEYLHDRQKFEFNDQTKNLELLLEEMDLYSVHFSSLRNARNIKNLHINDVVINQTKFQIG